MKHLCQNGRIWLLAILSIALVFATLGCGTTKPKSAATKPSASESEPEQPKSIVLREGDTIKVAFPDAPNLDTSVKIRRDGVISLPFGDVQAAGMTPAELEKEIIKRYGDQLVSKAVNVVVQSSAFWVYVTGAVITPGKILADRPLTALEAVMEAGGVDYSRANLKGVTITRKTKGRYEHFKVDLKSVIQGKAGDTFDLQSSDILYVPEKFSWF